MLTQPLLDQLQELRLRGMVAALRAQAGDRDAQALTFEERLSLLIQHEVTDRASARLAQRLRWARLPQNAVLEDLDPSAMRGLEPGILTQLRSLKWIGERLNVLICGPTGVGKSFLASALAHAACRADISVRCLRIPRLIDELTRAHALHNRSALLKQLAKAELIVLDDFGIAPLADQIKRDLLEILDDRYDRRSTVITSQLPVEQWHAYLADPTLADAILDRVVHNSYRVTLKGDSMRKHKAAAAQVQRAKTERR
jgi:DNA replication protein DnaC